MTAAFLGVVGYGSRLGHAEFWRENDHQSISCFRCKYTMRPGRGVVAPRSVKKTLWASNYC